MKITHTIYADDLDVNIEVTREAAEAYAALCDEKFHQMYPQAATDYAIFYGVTGVGDGITVEWRDDESPDFTAEQKLIDAAAEVYAAGQFWN